MSHRSTNPDFDLNLKGLAELTREQRWCINFTIALFGSFVKVENPENLTNVQDPILFVFNHNTSFETLLVPIYLFYLRGGKKFSFICDWMFAHLPIISWFFKQINPIYVYNKPSTLTLLNPIRQRHKDHSVIGQCVTRLQQGDSLGIFPEGTRNRDPFTLLKAKKGLGQLALLTGVPVLPIGIDFPKRRTERKIPAFGSLILRIGQPMTFQSAQVILEQSRNINAFSNGEQKQLQQLLAGIITTKIMGEIARLSGKRYPYPLPNIPDRFKSYVNELIVQ